MDLVGIFLQLSGQRAINTGAKAFGAGQALEEAGHFGVAAMCFDHAAEYFMHGPPNPNAQMAIDARNRCINRAIERKEIYELALKFSFKELLAHTEKCLAYYYQQQVPGLISAIKSAQQAQDWNECIAMADAIKYFSPNAEQFYRKQADLLVPYYKGQALWELRLFKQAIAPLRRAIQAAIQNKENELVGWCSFWLGDSLLHTNCQEAGQWLQKAIDFFKTAELTDWLARAYERYGLHLRSVGHVEDTYKAAQRAIQCYEILGDKDSSFRVIGQLAEWMSHLGQQAFTEEVCRRYIALAQKNGAPLDRIEQALANVFWQCTDPSISSVSLPKLARVWAQHGIAAVRGEDIEYHMLWLLHTSQILLVARSTEQDLKRVDILIRLAQKIKWSRLEACQRLKHIRTIVERRMGQQGKQMMRAKQTSLLQLDETIHDLDIEEYIRLGKQAYVTGQITKGRALFEQALQKTSEVCAQLCYFEQEVELAQKKGGIEEVASVRSAMLQRLKNQPEYQGEYGQIWQQWIKGSFIELNDIRQECLTSFRGATPVQPEGCDFLTRRAWRLWDCGKIVEAAEDLVRVILCEDPPILATLYLACCGGAAGWGAPYPNDLEVHLLEIVFMSAFHVDDAFLNTPEAIKIIETAAPLWEAALTRGQSPTPLTIEANFTMAMIRQRYGLALWCLDLASSCWNQFSPAQQGRITFFAVHFPSCVPEERSSETPRELPRVLHPQHHSSICTNNSVFAIPKLRDQYSDDNITVFLPEGNWKSAERTDFGRSSFFHAGYTDNDRAILIGQEKSVGNPLACLTKDIHTLTRQMDPRHTILSIQSQNYMGRQGWTVVTQRQIEAGEFQFRFHLIYDGKTWHRIAANASIATYPEHEEDYVRLYHDIHFRKSVSIKSDEPAEPYEKTYMGNRFPVEVLIRDPLWLKINRSMGRDIRLSFRSDLACLQVCVEPDVRHPKQALEERFLGMLENICVKKTFSTVHIKETTFSSLPAVRYRCEGIPCNSDPHERFIWEGILVVDRGMAYDCRVWTYQWFHSVIKLQFEQILKEFIVYKDRPIPKPQSYRCARCSAEIKGSQITIEESNKLNGLTKAHILAYRCAHCQSDYCRKCAGPLCRRRLLVFGKRPLCPKCNKEFDTNTIVVPFLA